MSGFGQQLADLIGGLVGSSDGGLPGATDAGDLDGADEPPLDDDANDDSADEDDADEDSADDDPDDPDVPDIPADEAPPDAVPIDQETEAGPTPCTGESVPEPTLVPTVVEPQLDSPPPPQAMPEAAAETHEPTPCEIAADELPQVGE